jgi:hypothetical protein
MVGSLAQACQEFVLKATHRAHSPEATAAQPQVWANRRAREKLKWDSRALLAMFAPAASRWDRLAQAFFALGQKLSVPSRD